MQNNEITLLKQYITTLQHQTKTKNTERETLYTQLQTLQAQNLALGQQLTYLREQAGPMHGYIGELEYSVRGLREELQGCVGLLREREGEIGGLGYQREMDAERVRDLEGICREARRAEAKLKEELAQLREELDQLREQNQSLKSIQTQTPPPPQDCQQCTHTSQQLNQLISNYQKIEQLARQKQSQNDDLRLQNQALAEELEQLREQLKGLEGQVRYLKKMQVKREEMYYSSRKQGQGQWEKEGRERQGEREELFANISLIKQNNRLIQRVTELEKEKNMLYIESVDAWRDSDYPSPLKALSARPSTADYESQDQIRSRLQALKSANQTLLERLKI